MYRTVPYLEYVFEFFWIPHRYGTVPFNMNWSTSVWESINESYRKNEKKGKLFPLSFMVLPYVSQITNIL